MKSQTKKMREIRDEILKLPSSSLIDFRTENNSFPVIGEGDHDAELMFIGEAPGKNEAKTGRPFCGAAGKILDELLGSIKLDREKVYITNIVKDRPPQNRDPLPEEIELYSPYLDRQINIIKPKIIATLGRFSMVYIMEKFELHEELKPISAAHGTVLETSGTFGTIKILPLYHPAAAIYNRALIDVLREDFKKIKTLINK